MPTSHDPARSAYAVTGSRLEAFSDGVFAIAITLLVIDLAVPGPDVRGAELTDALGGVLPNFFSFVLSFLVIGRYWIAHHMILDHARRRDGRLIWLNLLFLFSIAFLPFPTALLGEHGDTALAVIVYASTISVVGCLSAVLWTHVVRTNAVDPKVARRGLIRAAAVPAVFIASIPVIAVWPTGGSVAWAAGIFWLAGLILLRAVARLRWAR